METYLFKSTVCLAIFYTFYKVLLERENMHLFKRFYWLGALVASFLIPFITFIEYIEVSIPQITTAASPTVTVLPATVEPPPNYIAIALWSLYLMGVVFFGGIFIWNLFSMLRKIRKNPQVQDGKIRYVLLRPTTTPHTFFRYIFLNKSQFESHRVPKEILVHETVHAREWHSLDVLFIELLLVVGWFNPLLHYIKRCIKLNHEFLADRSVLSKGADAVAYQNTILAFSSNAFVPRLANSISYSFIKKRFTIMKKNTSKTSFWIRSIVILPLLTLLIYGFSARETIVKEPDAVSTQASHEKKIVLKIKNNQITVNGKATSVEGFARTLDNLTKGWSSKELTNCLLDIQIQNGNKHFMEQLEEAYRKTRLYQARQSKLVPNPPPPPPAPEPVLEPNAVDAVSPPPPPPPPVAEEPLEFVMRMAKEGASFYYGDTKISSDKAIEIIQKSNMLHVESHTDGSGLPTVIISKEPIEIQGGKTGALEPDESTIGPKEDPANIINGYLIMGTQFFMDGKPIAPDEAQKWIRHAPGLRIEVDRSDPEKLKVNLVGC